MTSKIMRTAVMKWVNAKSVYVILNNYYTREKAIE